MKPHTHISQRFLCLIFTRLICNNLYLKAFYSKNIIKMLKAQQIAVEIYWLTLIHTSHHLFLQKQTLTTLE